MSTLYLLVLDSIGIQPYIFGSNRLRENVGASHLVHMASVGWLLSEPNKFLGANHNIQAGQIQSTATVGGIETGTLDAEVVYAGGGNTVILFREVTQVIRFKAALSHQILSEAPGLELVVETVEFDWTDSLASAMEQAMFRLSARKLQAEGNRPLQGIAVTAACRSTGMAANVTLQEPGSQGSLIPLSSEVAAKWYQADAAQRRLHEVVLANTQMEFQIPNQFDHLGRSVEEFSYIAVIHADGNHMGMILQDITRCFSDRTGANNRQYVEALRAFSAAANVAGVSALRAVIDFVAEVNRTKIVAPSSNKNGDYLSMRPIVFGGDDVTLVCDGRIGLQSAAVFLEAFSRHTVPDASGQAQRCTAAAGISIVKSRYPFARAYELSSQLCSNAKHTSNRDYSALDFHLAQSGLFGSLREIRRTEYGEEWNGDQLKRSILMRPLALERTSSADWRNWRDFVDLLSTFKNIDQWPRNKVMKLKEALRAGPAAVRAFRTNYRQQKLPDMRLNSDGYRDTGWDGERCVYFDAIEMIEQEVMPWTLSG